jgi:hypothetical protein
MSFTASNDGSPRAEADRKRSPGERRGPEPLMMQRLSTIVVVV